MSTSSRRHLHPRAARRRDERGAVAVITAIMATLLLVIAGLAVDIANSWAVRGMLQQQADSAALYAAGGLPVKLGSTQAAIDDRVRVAKMVAFKIACSVAGPNGTMKEVRGQREVDPSIPACPTSDTSSTLTTYATKLLNTGLVSFPTSTSVTVTTPVADVDFGFSQVIGASGVQEQKTATAKAYSPGAATSIALSYTCLLSAAGSSPAGLGNALSYAVPINYIAAGTVATAPANLGVPSFTAPDSGNAGTTVVPVSVFPTAGVATSVSMTFTNVDAKAQLLPPATTAAAYFYQKQSDGSVTKLGPITVSPTAAYTPLTGTGTASVTFPSAGVWYLKEAITYKTNTGTVLQPSYTPTTRFSSNAVTPSITVAPNQSYEDLTACANLTDSPRRDTDNRVEAGTLRRNLAAGMDHELSPFPSVVNLNVPPLTSSSALSALGQLFDCSGNAATVLDGPGVKTTPQPNCAHIATGSVNGTSTYNLPQEFTEGILGSANGSFAGRLACTGASPCARSFTLPPTSPAFAGRTFNDDTLTDFKRTPGSVLSQDLFFGLSTYFTDSLPLVSPPSTSLSPTIYSSPRFMWVAVVSKAQQSVTSPLTGIGGVLPSCSDCPVLTFRPVFLTQAGQPTGIAGTQLNLGAITQSLTGLLLGSTSGVETHGVVMKGDTLRALRFVTLEPKSLPVPPATYSGPLSDYLGVGPRITRLIK